MPIAMPSANEDTYFDRDDEDAAPKVGTTIQEGWDAVDASLAKSADYPTDLRFSPEPVLIKFLDGPYLFGQHWLDDIKKGRKSFTCIGDDCPLCDMLGDHPRQLAKFNVYVYTGEDKGLKTLQAVPTLLRLIKKAHEDDRKGPLTREYWTVSREGTGNQTQYSLDFVRSRDLEEEFGIDPDKAKELASSVTPWTKEQMIRVDKHADLLDVARSLIN
jgi:hypothetical protein